MKVLSETKENKEKTIPVGRGTHQIWHFRQAILYYTLSFLMEHHFPFPSIQCENGPPPAQTYQGMFNLLSSYAAP